MIKLEVIVSNRLGLHARPATKLVKAASTGSSVVHISKDGKRINARSILGVMLLEAAWGTRVIIEVSGDDEIEVMQRIVQLFNDKFGEE